MTTPGAIGAFSKATATATPAMNKNKPPAIGGTKFPGSIPIKTALLPPVSAMLPFTKEAAVGNAALGAMFAALFGRASAMIPGVKELFANNPTMRDAAIGAAVATVLGLRTEESEEEQEPQRSIYNPRPTPLPNGWKLQ
jgi:hypothetical protein